MRSNTALDMGVAMRLHIREDRQAASANPALSLAAGDNRACSRSLFVGIGASGRSSARGGDVASDCRHCWLASARLHLTPLVFDAGFEDLCIRPSQGPSLLACGTGTCHVCWLPAKAGRARYRPSDAHVQRLPRSEVQQRYAVGVASMYVCMYVTGEFIKLCTQGRGRWRTCARAMLRPGFGRHVMELCTLLCSWFVLVRQMTWHGSLVLSCKTLVTCLASCTLNVYMGTW